MKTIVFLTLVGIFATSAHAQTAANTISPGTKNSSDFRTGNQLLMLCQSETLIDKTFCLGYIVGVTDTIGALQTTNDSNGKLFWRLSAVCFPEGIDAGQVRDVVVKYLVNNPEARSDSAAGLIIIALIKAWGCPVR